MDVQQSEMTEEGCCSETKMLHEWHYPANNTLKTIITTTLKVLYSVDQKVTLFLNHIWVYIPIFFWWCISLQGPVCFVKTCCWEIHAAEQECFYVVLTLREQNLCISSSPRLMQTNVHFIPHFNDSVAIRQGTTLSMAENTLCSNNMKCS